ncbi:DUF1570 domain-containing protein [Planctomicrobium sp. SH668]|uniref:DUF1570 domain-containing protein n=1 Tax=Planctomicrobium sp. SH668 TaxID=3448126 RepID=UPI003F5CA272
MFQQAALSCFLILILGVFSPLCADEFTYVEDGKPITIEARLIGSGQGFQALERRDGQIALVQASQITDRKNTGDPEPFTPEEMAERLTTLFGQDLTKVHIQGQCVVALVLASPIEKVNENRVTSFLKKGATFMNNVENVFLRYAKFSKFPLRPLRFPTVLVVFESDVDFDNYATAATGGRSLSSSSILGFYSGLTNWLAVRLSSCDTFETPLHEAIHQQMYNRVFHRIAQIPKWFDEGIAISFEGKGEKVDSSPSKVNAKYARISIDLPEHAEWGKVAGDDRSFMSDDVAGHAYSLAWALHWTVSTQHREEYRNYVSELATRETLATLTRQEEDECFLKHFGKPMEQMREEFLAEVKDVAKRQRISLSDPPPGKTNDQQGLGQYQVTAAITPGTRGNVQVEGKLKNISPVRAMSFYVTVETGNGLYADWLIPDLNPNQSKTLPRQLAVKPVPGAEGGRADTFRVFVRSVPAESAESIDWKQGKTPSPVTAKSK